MAASVRSPSAAFDAYRPAVPVATATRPERDREDLVTVVAGVDAVGQVVGADQVAAPTSVSVLVARRRCARA